MTEDTGLRILEAVGAGVEAVWEEALMQHRGGDTTEAYRLDALERLVVRGDTCTWNHHHDGKAPSGRRPRNVHLRVDAVALRRGAIEEGEVCEVPGVGPVSLAAARSLLADSVIDVIVLEGVDVAAVAAVGDTVPAALAVAVSDRDPECVVPGCRSADCLQIVDYTRDPADPTARRSIGLGNLARLCQHHHRLWAYQGFDLKGGPGDWAFTGPDGTTWADFLASTHPDGDPIEPAFADTG